MMTSDLALGGHKFRDVSHKTQATMLKALVLALALGLGFAQEDPASCSIAEPCEAFNLEALNQVRLDSKNRRSLDLTIRHRRRRTCASSTSRSRQCGH